MSSNQAHKLVNNASTVILDSDGVLVEEGFPLPGAQDFVEHLLDQGKNVVVLSNNSTTHPYVMKENYHDKGILVSNIINSGMVTAEYCKHNDLDRIYAIGEIGLLDLLQEYNVTITDRNVDAIVVGMDRDLTYKKLAIATRLLRDGALFIATNPDPAFPTPRGLEPGAGSMIAALQASTDKDPDLILGKPERYGYELVMDTYEVKNEDCVMIGDRYETDILGAVKVNIPSLIVNTGIAASRSNPGTYKDYPKVPVIESLTDLF